MIPLTAALILENQRFRDQVIEALKDIPVRVLLDQGGIGDWHLVKEKLERLLPDVVLMDLADLSEQRFAYLQQIRTMAQPPAIVVIHDSGDAQIILTAMRAGAAEFLTLPLEEGALTAALERISLMLPGRQPGKEVGGQMVAFLAAKGGAGSTTLACNIAVARAKTSGQEVLLADLDLETGNVAFAMKAASQYSILEACHNISRLDLHYWRGLVSNGLPGLNILTAPDDLRGLDPPQAVQIRQVLRFARSIYSLTVVDLPSSLNRLTLAVLEDADQTFLISNTDLPCLHRAKRTLQMLIHAGYRAERLALVLNRTSRRDEVTSEDIQRNVGVPVFWSFPEDVTGVTDFYVKGGLIRAGTSLGKSIRQFVQKLPGAPPAPVKKKSFLGI